MNRSHNNSGHIALNKIKKTGLKHSSERNLEIPSVSKHLIVVQDSINY